MRIVLAAHHIAPRISGAAFQVSRLGEALTLQGHHVVIYNSMKSGNSVNGILHRRPFIIEKPAKLKRYSLNLSLTSWKYWLKKDRPDIVHFYGVPKINIAGMHACLFLGIPFTYRSDLINFNDLSTLLSGHYLYHVVTHAQAFISISKALYNQNAQHVGNSKHILIPNGMDTDTFAPREKNYEIQKEYHIPCNNVAIVMVGVLDARKNQMDALRAFLKRYDELRHTTLILIGDVSTKDPDYRSVLLSFIDNNRLGNHIRLVGPQTNITAWLNNADILLHTALEEGNPNAVLEAMASGMPVVASLITGITDYIIEDLSTGLIVKDVEEMGEALVRLSNDHGLRRRLGESARASILSRFNINKVAEAHVHVWMEAIQNSAVARTSSPHSW